MKTRGLLVLSILVLCSWSFGQFSAPVNVSQSADASLWPSVVFTSEGVVHMVWVRMYSDTSSDVVYSKYDGTTWSTPIPITAPATGPCSFPFISSNANGMLAAVWEQNLGETWCNTFDPVLKAWGIPERVDETWTGFLNKPKVALDSSGNIHAFYFTRGLGYGFVRDKVDGVWEPRVRLNIPGLRTKEGNIFVDKNDTVWVVYANKMPGGQYHVFYRIRPKGLGWSVGGIRAGECLTTEEQVYGAVDPTTNIPWVAYMGNFGTEGSNFVDLVELDRDKYPREHAIPEQALHYPRLAIDVNGVRHIATQMGQGDNGRGILYTNNSGGTWHPPIIFPNSSGGPKLPNIAAEDYGNIAVVWDSEVNGVPQVWFTSRVPVAVKHFYAPVSLSETISISGAVLHPAININLSWAKNPDNNDDFVRGYMIYQKVGYGEFTPLMEVNKTTFSQTITLTSYAAKIQFAIATVPPNGTPGEKATF